MSGALTRAAREGVRAFAADLDVSTQVTAVLNRISTHPSTIGWNCVEFPLPVTFPRAPDPDAARLLVHNGIVAALERRGFRVCLTGPDAAPVLLVGWRSAIGHAELRQLQQKLDAIRLDGDAAANFRETGNRHLHSRTAAPPAAGLRRRRDRKDSAPA